MSNSNFKMADRILSILLAFIMIVSLMPMTVFASTEANPGKFTVTVKNESDEPITDAGIFYEIFVDSESKVSGNLSTTNGEAVIPNVSDYSDDIADESKTVEISYQITKDGYTTVNNKVTVTDAKGNIDVTMFAVAPETTNVSVVKNGDGKVEINNEEITSSAVDKGSEVTFRFTPDEGSYIKEVKIGDVSEEITDSNLFEKTITADEDISVSVTFVKTFTVVVTKNDGGTVKLNNEAVTSRDYDENDTAEINVIPEEGYQIDSVKIGDIEQTIDDVNNFSTSFSVTEDVNVDVSFVKVYVITVSYDGKGTVETSPECVGGSVTVKTGTIVSVKATPAVNYRVLNVVINDQVDIETTDNTYDSSNPYTKNLNANQNYTIKITFALKLCNINVNAPEHGSVSVESNSVNYGDDTTVTIIPDSGYVVNTVKDDDVDLTDKLYTKDESALELKLENITKDKDIKVEFKLSEAATIDNIMWNDTEALRTNTDENLYVFAEGSSVTFSTTKEAIRINGESQEEWKSSEWSINENKIITKIELYYDLGWHEVKNNGESVYYNIVFDADDPVPTISPLGANDYGYYNTDVQVVLKAVDSSNYSGLNTVEYWVTCDETETERKTLYAYSDGDEIKSEFNDDITVYAEKNNSDNVKVYLEVTDRAGNKSQTSTDLKINSTVPTLSVSIDGTLDNEAIVGYYNSNRVATVKIVDRASCFDETLAEDGIDISAVDAKGNPINITKASMIDWTHNRDTHTATITFSEEAIYSWSVSYTSKSGLSNIGLSETGDSIYNFAVDKTAPTGTISIDADNKWDALLSSLTFGIWKNYSVTATADGSDDISPVYDIKYYKSNSDSALSENELITLYEAGKFTTEKYTVYADELFVVYARISDYAGNTLYIGSNGIIVDTTGSENQITLTSDEPNANGYYNSDVNVAVEVDEEVVSGQAYSGIKTVDYAVEKDGVKTQEGNLFTFDISNPTQKQLVNEWTGSITVDASRNNSDNVKAIVTVTDNAGNEYSKDISLSINSTDPAITISFDNNKCYKIDGNRGYFGKSRTATITITDRSSTFNEENATNGIKITAVDGNNNDVAINKDEMIGEWKHDGDKHTVDVTFADEANYTWSANYTNEADKSNSDVSTTGQITPYEFTVDTTKPTGSVTVEANTWDKLLEVLTFGLYKNSTAKVSATADDDTSPVVIEYYKTSNATVMTEKELDAVTDWTAFENSALEQNGVSPDEQFVVYLKITDYAGNYIYINSDGYIVEKSESKIVLTPEEANEKGIYGLEYENGINVDVKITDSEPYSGIRTVDYWVEKDGVKTQEGNLFTFDISNPTQKQLVNEWTGSITVDPTINNSCDTVVYVKTVDNAGNERTESAALDIDVTAPTIRITYDDTANVNAEEGYFTSRTATVVITERIHHFDADAATNGITINAVDANGKAIENAYTISDWTTAEGKTADAATHTATIKFNKDANYTFAISYTDNADNKNTEPDVTGQTVPYEFTVDTTKPTGSVTVEANTWDKLLEVLTFGLYKNSTAKVSATADDDTSPVVIEYYKTSNATVMTEKELDAVTDWTAFENSALEQNGVSPDEQFVVYLKITDYAGNYIYINSDGYIVEKSESKIVLTPEEANEKGIYGLEYENGINVDVKITDSEPYSGIRTVDYWVEKDGVKTQEGNLFTFDISNPTQKQLVNEWTGSITVDPTINNSCDTVVYVKTVDNAGNERTESAALDIDVTAPTIRITYDDTANVNAEEGYFTSRTATVVITERIHHFDADAATNGITINAVDANGKAIENAYTISDWTTAEGKTADAATHTATIKFNKDANYTFAISYTDNADNKNTEPDVTGQTAPYEFTVDTTKPTGSVTAKSSEGRTETWSSLIDTLTFGFWSNKKISIFGTSNDVTSPIASVQYYMPVATNASDETSALDAKSLDNISSWKSFNGFDVTVNKQFTVYLKITDNAGNYTYVGTNGLIVDDQHPVVESVAPEITVTPEKPINGIYKDDVKVSIKVDDPMVSGTYSGLKEITYKVFDRASATPNTPTQEGTLYTFSNSNPKQSELLKTWTGNITVKSAKNNSNNIQIVVYAVDNAGNAGDNSQKGSSGYTVIKIDTTAPVIDISYNNNNADSNTYFKDNRVATIKITERNFNADDVKIKVTKSGSEVKNSLDWKDITGSYNLDNSTHTTTITYGADGDYTFAIEYIDLAGNKCTSINFANGTVAESKFTIDKTLPTVEVSYDNNSAQNSNYYKESRTATIVITEHNFNTDRVDVTMTATDDGVEKTVPKLNGWTSNGDRHTATINYTDDAKYTFDIAFKDMAGNDAADFANQTFYVDKTVPSLEITGVKDKSANSGDVIPVVTYTDTNFDDSQVNITLVGANRKDVALLGNYSDIHNGKVFTFDNFAKEKDIDDIYTLYATLTDKAGNTSKKSINFSVNRFGSTYVLSDETATLNGSYAKTPIDIMLSEINANELKNIKITLFKNDKTIVLEEGTDYRIDVVGGDGQWYQYKYTIFKENFEEDGVYRLTIYSEDAAGNVAENTLDTKETELGFGIDKTPPTINVNNLESNKTYALERLKVQMTVDDNLKLDSVVVYLDGEECQKWTGEDLEKIVTDNENFTFDVSGNSTGAHTVKILATDSAGNESIEEINDFYVTTNIFVRYYNNKPLFFGSIAGVIVVVGLIVFLVVFKRRKKEDR
jgi:hypothetical protein